MSKIIQFVTDHWFAVSFISAYVFVGLIATMPSPGDPRSFGQKLYQWGYDFLHLMSNKVAEKKGIEIPVNPTK